MTENTTAGSWKTAVSDLSGFIQKKILQKAYIYGHNCDTHTGPLVRHVLPLRCTTPGKKQRVYHTLFFAQVGTNFSQRFWHKCRNQVRMRWKSYEFIPHDLNMARSSCMDSHRLHVIHPRLNRSAILLLTIVLNFFLSICDAFTSWPHCHSRSYVCTISGMVTLTTSING